MLFVVLLCRSLCSSSPLLTCWSAGCPSARCTSLLVNSLASGYTVPRVAMDNTDTKSLPTETVSDEADVTSVDDIDLSAFPTAAPTAASIVVLDKHITHAALYNRKPTILRLDVLPFLILYGVLLLLALPALQYEVAAITASPPAVVTPAPLLAIAKNDTDDDDLLLASASFDQEVIGGGDAVEAGEPAPPLFHFIAMYALPVAAIIHAVTFLSAFWSIRFNSALRYSRQPLSSLSTAQLIRILPALHCGAPALCPLERTIVDSQPTTHFTYQKTKYLFTPPPPSTAIPPPPAFIPLSYPTTSPLSSYLSHRGHTSATAVAALSKYGSNVFDIPLPSFWELYTEHAVAPFFIFQIFCVLLWCLDEYWYYSLMTLFMLVSFEGTVVKRRQKHLEYVRDMRVPPYKVWLYRDGRWDERLTSDIVPGDVVSMVRTSGENVVPCDLLLLSGQCVVNEALLTGESVPQVKEAIDLQDGDQPLNINKQHKRHTLYGGTKILLTSHKTDELDTPFTARSSVKPATDGGCVCYALKTGFASSQGRLVRTILYSTERVSVNNTESLLFILFLLVFAIAASGYVLYHGLLDSSRSRYKLLLNCVDEDTMVTMADGRRRRIKHVRPGDHILAYHRQRGGAFPDSRMLVPRRVQTTLERGKKDCIELVLYDGRTLICTPDHRVLVEGGRWLAARDVLQSGLKVAVGLRPPIDADDSSVDNEWKVQLDTLRLDLSKRREQTLAFFRLLGYVLTDGTVTLLDGQPAAHAFIGHEVDVASVVRDIELLTGVRPGLSLSSNTYQISLSAELARAIVAAGCLPGQRGDYARPLPPVVMNAPLPVVRAFLSGFFGGDGHTMHLCHQTAAGFLTGMGWSMSCRGKVAAAQAALLQNELGTLLERCGLPRRDLVWRFIVAVTGITASGRREIKRRKLAGERLSSQVDLSSVDDSVSVSIRLSMLRACVLPFADSIGFAYCSHKQLRLEVAATVIRTMEFALSQRRAVYSHFLTLTGTFAHRLATAKAAVAATTALHPTVLAWKLQQLNQIAAAVTDVGFEKGGYGGLAPKALLADWAALDFFSAPRKTPYSASAVAASLAAAAAPSSPSQPSVKKRAREQTDQDSDRESGGRQQRQKKSKVVVERITANNVELDEQKAASGSKKKAGRATGKAGTDAASPPSAVAKPHGKSVACGKPGRKASGKVKELSYLCALCPDGGKMVEKTYRAGHNKRHYPNDVLVGRRGKRLDLELRRATTAAGGASSAVLSRVDVERFKQVAELAAELEGKRVANADAAHNVMVQFIYTSPAPAVYAPAAAGVGCGILYQLHGPLSLEFGKDSEDQCALTFEVLETAATTANLDFRSVLFTELVPIVWDDWFDDELELLLRDRKSAYAKLSRASAGAALQSPASVFVLFGGHSQEAYRELLQPDANSAVAISTAVRYYTARAHGRTITVVECPHPAESQAYAAVMVAMMVARTLHSAAEPVDVAALAALGAKAAVDEPEWGRGRVRWAVPRGMEGVPLFYLPVIEMREVGKRKVYDLVVPVTDAEEKKAEEEEDEASFLANGIAVHNCIMIITSVVPPELPMELSLAVNTSLLHLAQHQVFCTEPFRIPLAGAIDICCFDKTGTLTADEFRVSGVAGLTEGKEEGGELVDAKDVKDEVKWVIAGCHSLTHIADAGLVGDPLEKAAFDAIKWSYNKADTAASADGKQKVRILHRFAFTSVLKRMSCVVSLEHESGGGQLRCVVKGAAEVLEPMFANLPPQYARCHQHWARQGCRVLAMGYKVLPLRDSADDRRKVRELKRDYVESGLTFAGFLVSSCPLKWDSVAVVRHLMDSSHAVLMITGDNTLTAASVARELAIVTRDALILTHTADRVEWLDVDGQNVQPFDLTFSPATLSALVERYDLCVSGDAMEYLMHQLRVPAAQLATLFPFVRVFARTSPDQKELILTRLKLAGRVTLMVGDGTNDVFASRTPRNHQSHLSCPSDADVVFCCFISLSRGALKQAHVGVALIGTDESDKKRKEMQEQEQKQLTAAAAGPPALSLKPPAQPSKFQQMMQLTRKVQTEQQVAERASGRTWSNGERKAFIQQRFQVEMKALTGGGAAGAMEEAPQIRLGDASIASPFTSKVPYISSVLHIVRQGRCTLVTTLQMFNILGINALISAYSMSVLYLDGVKMGDVQMTFAGLSVAMFFLFVSRSKPLDRLSAERPPSRLFTAHMMLSILGQFALHFATLLTAVRLSNPHTPTDTETRSTDTAFKPNVLNTVVYLVSTMATTATFVANYRGRPFMQGLRENVWLWRVLLLNVVAVLVMASGVLPEVNEWMQLVPMPSGEMHYQLMGLVLFDLCSTVAYANLLKRIFAIKPPKQSVQRAVAGGRQQRLKGE